MAKVLEKSAIVVVTYKREELLQVLFDSYVDSTYFPEKIYIVDNGQDISVSKMCENLEKRLSEKIDQGFESTKVAYVPMETNTGGAGGFSKGTEIAYKDGAEWIWLMDDDVKVLPDALERLIPWMDEAVENDRRVIQCRRYNYDDTVFYWQYHFWNHLGIPNPIAPAGFKADEKFRTMNTACFEGGLFHRSIVQELGAPDNRFFIYWDDTVYGYLASKITQPIMITDILMQRTRTIDNVKLGTIRKLNATSDMARYHIMRNRGYMAKYFMIHGDYNSFVFSIGTLLTLCKEIIRMFITKNFSKGMAELRRGMKDAKVIIKDDTWQPMPKL